MTLLRRHVLVLAAVLAIPAGALAQIGLPALPAINLGDLTGRLQDIANIDQLAPRQLSSLLAQARLDRITAFLRQNRAIAADDGSGRPAVRGVLIVSGADDAAIARAEAAGFRLLDRETVAGLDLNYARLATPAQLGLPAAAARLRKLVGEADVTFDHYFFLGGATGGEPTAAAAASSVPVNAPRVGIIDGGVARHPTLTGSIEQHGFAPGAPFASAHGTAVASLVAGTAPQRGAVPGLPLLVADVYGNGPGGGTATAVVRALGWMAERRVPIVTLSLVGPDNALLLRAIRAAQAHGTLIVAAVGNDGPAAPPAYPASYPGVLAVTGTDKRQRVLPEAGHALHVDFAAPGADIKGAAPNGRLTAVRGTSFAAPLVAGRLAEHYRRADIDAIEPSVTALIAEARHLGRNGRDPVIGHGLVCAECGAR